MTPEESGPAGMLSDSLLEITWRNRWIILATMLVCLALALGYLHKATPIFKSESKLYVEQTGPRIINELEQGVMTQSTNYLYTQAVLVKSTPILAAALEKKNLTHLRVFTDIDNPVAFLKKRLLADVGKKDNLLTVGFKCPYPAEAAQLVNAVVDEYVTYHSAQAQHGS